MKDVTNENFGEEVLSVGTPVVVDFWAPWCGPCKMMGPILDALDKKYEGKVKFVKVNVDEQQELSANYNVRGLPTFYVIKDGEVADTLTGATTKGKFAEFVEKNL